MGNLMGARDRAIVEVLYSTGIRRMELIGLSIPDLDTERGTVLIRRGKGQKDRIIPIGDRAMAWVGKYLQQLRYRLMVPGSSGDTLFLTRQGRALAPNRLSKLVADLVSKASLGKTGSCHLFRHTMATAMLENGADIRYIQAMLGHVDLKTTALYTRVSIRMLKRVHTAKHPARMAQKKGGEEDN